MLFVKIVGWVTMIELLPLYNTTIKQPSKTQSFLSAWLNFNSLSDFVCIYLKQLVKYKDISCSRKCEEITGNKSIPTVHCHMTVNLIKIKRSHLLKSFGKGKSVLHVVLNVILP